MKRPRVHAAQAWLGAGVVLGCSVAVLPLSSLFAAPDGARTVPQAHSASQVSTPQASAAQPVALQQLPEVVAMRQELQRSLTHLKLPQRDPAYFGAYWLIDFEQRYVHASAGALVARSEDQGRRLRVELRVGDKQTDNSNFGGGEPQLDFSADGDGLTMLGQNLDIIGLRRAFWLASDSAYRHATEALDNKRAFRSGQVELQQRPPDFSDETLESLQAPPSAALPELAQLQANVLAASKVFARFPALDDGGVSATAWWVQRTLVSSGGAGGAGEQVVSREPTRLVQYQIQATAQAADGMPLQHSVSVFGEPTVAQLEAHAERLAQGLTSSMQAELVEDCYGPVLFQGQAAAQIAHELLSMNLSGTPQGEESEGQFARRLGKRVLPDGVVVFDDPTLQVYAGHALIGGYLFDDEGVKAQRVELVRDGRLQTLLMSRTPSRQLAKSNGHGRSGLSGWARGMLGNLVIEPRQGVSAAQLRAKLLAAAREQRAEFGLVIERLAERSFGTGGMSPPVPEQAYKLYLDGRRVPVRGGELSEMNVRELRTLLATGQKLHAYHYVVPWSSGLPGGSSVLAPDLLFEEVELTRPKRSYRRPKVLPRPVP